MITLRKSKDRGHVNHGWLDTYHTFSFGDYYDEEHVHFRTLRVINDDRVAAGHGFPPHSHRDMEIITYILEGALEHKDSMGNGSVIRPGDVQRMSAGSGVQHSEFNPSKTEGTHLLQIWILPERPAISPGYEEKKFPLAEREGRLRLIASRDGRAGSVTVHQDIALYASILPEKQDVTHSFAPHRAGWLHVAKGGVTVNGIALAAGDAARIERESKIEIVATERSEILLFDLA